MKGLQLLNKVPQSLIRCMQSPRRLIGTGPHITSAAAMQTAPEMIEIAAHFLGPAALSVCPMPGLKTSSPFFAGAAFSIICLRERTND